MKALKDFKTAEDMGLTDLPWIARKQESFDDWDVIVTNPIFHHMTVLDGSTAKLTNLLAAAPDMYLEGLKLLKEKCGDCTDFKSDDACKNCKTCLYGGLRAAVEKAQNYDVDSDVEEGGAK